MSYSGRLQVWCKGGHYWAQDCWDEDPTQCHTCHGPIARLNSVDDTNGESYGYIEPVIATPPVFCNCGECGNKHIKKLATYVVPHPGYRGAQ